MIPNAPTVDPQLERADRLRDGDDADRAAAAEAYAASADRIDPATVEGCHRVLWLLTQGRAIDARLEDLVTRTVESACDEETREVAEVLLFKFPLQRGEVAIAERHLRRLLDRHRRSGNPREIGVLNDLALVYQSSQREFEALVLGRRAYELATTHDAPLGRAVACARIMWALERLQEWDELEDQVTAMLAVLPTLDPCHHTPALRAVHSARRAILLAAGNWDGARHEHAMLVAAGPARALDADDAFDGSMLEAHIALGCGRLADAAAIARPASGSQPPGSRRWFVATDLLARSLAAATGARSAVATAMSLHEAMTAPESARHGVGFLLGIATAVGTALGDHPTAGLFFEAASTLLLRRIEELEDCVSGIEEVSGTAERDRAMLARCRNRYVADHRRALQAIAQIYDDPGVPRPPVVERLADRDRIRICAWCLTMRTPDGRTLPIGHLLPDSARLGVTHGICDDCRRGVGV